MAHKRKQVVKTVIVWPDGTTKQEEIDGTNEKNLISKIQGYIKNRLVNYSADEGMSITFHIQKVEADEFANTRDERLE